MNTLLVVYVNCNKNILTQKQNKEMERDSKFPSLVRSEKKNLHNWAARGVAKKWAKKLKVIHLRVLPWVAGKDNQSVVLEKTERK